MATDTNVQLIRRFKTDFIAGRGDFTQFTQFLDQITFDPIFEYIIQQFKGRSPINPVYRALLYPIFHELVNIYQNDGELSYTRQLYDYYVQLIDRFNCRLRQNYSEDVLLIDSILDAWIKFYCMLRYMNSVFDALNLSINDGLHKTSSSHIIEHTTIITPYSNLTVYAIQSFLQIFIQDTHNTTSAIKSHLNAYRYGQISYEESGLQSIYDLLKIIHKGDRYQVVRNVDQYLSIQLNIDKITYTIVVSYCTYLEEYCADFSPHLQEMNTREMIRTIGQIIERETQMTHQLLDKRFIDRILQQVYIHLISNIVDQIMIDMSFLLNESLLNADDPDKCAIYRVSKLVDQFDPIHHMVHNMATIYGSYLRTKMQECMRPLPLAPETKENESERKRAVIDMLRAIRLLHSTTQQMLTDAFDSNLLIVQMHRTVMKEFMNNAIEHYGTFIQLICDHIHGLIIKRIPCDTDDAIMAESIDLCKLVAYIDDKDVFIETYRSKLSIRLIQKKTEMVDVEQAILSYLKSIGGIEYTRLCENMITDITCVTVEVMENLRQHDLGEIMNLTVLTLGKWPTPRRINDLHIPVTMDRLMNHTTMWYNHRYGGSRRLTFCHVWGDLVLKTLYTKPRSYDLTVSPLQAMVLLLFDTDQPISIQSIADRLNLSAADHDIVKKTIHSLTQSRDQLVLRQSDTPATIQMTDMVELNMRYSSKLHRIKIPMPSLDKVVTTSNIDAHVSAMREHQTDAVIVRIMKSRKTCSHQDLIGQVMQQLTMFQSTPSAIKRRIETLIEREYLERNEDGNVYTYMA